VFQLKKIPGITWRRTFDKETRYNLKRGENSWGARELKGKRFRKKRENVTNFANKQKKNKDDGGNGRIKFPRGKGGHFQMPHGEGKRFRR